MPPALGLESRRVVTVISRPMKPYVPPADDPNGGSKTCCCCIQIQVGVNMIGLMTFLAFVAYTLDMIKGYLLFRRSDSSEQKWSLYFGLLGLCFFLISISLIYFIRHYFDINNYQKRLALIQALNLQTVCIVVWTFVHIYYVNELKEEHEKSKGIYERSI